MMAEEGGAGRQLIRRDGDKVIGPRVFGPKAITTVLCTTVTNSPSPQSKYLKYMSRLFGSTGGGIRILNMIATHEDYAQCTHDAVTPIS